MSKNTDRYDSKHLEKLDEDSLLEMDSAKFERFAPKRNKKEKTKKQHCEKLNDRDEY